MTHRVRRLLGYLPQEFGLYPKVTAWDMLEHFAMLKGIGSSRVRRQVVDGLLRRVNLFDVAASLAAKLENKLLAAMIDPFGMSAVEHVTRIA